MASIRKRTWESKAGETKTAWVADYFDAERKRHIRTFPTRKEADKWLVNARNEIKEGIHTPENTSITVREASVLWLKRCEQLNREWTTLRTYREHANIHILPVIGELKLARLTKPQVEAFKDKLLDKAISHSTASKVLTSLKGIIGEAQRRGLVAQNVAMGVRIEASNRTKQKLVVGRDIPDKDEISALIAAAHGRWRPLLITAVFTGLRASEIRGLTWDHVDFDKKVIRVDQRADAAGYIGHTKSEAGQRTVPMTPMVLSALREWKLACPKGDQKLVFPSGAGNVEYLVNIVSRGFKPIQVKAGVVNERGGAKYHFHALRHFFASWIIEQGFSPKKVQALMGHSSIQMSFDRYGHLFPSLEDDHAKFAAGELSIVGGS